MADVHRGSAARAGDFSRTVPLSAGTAFTITVREAGSSQPHRYHVRCLPSDFPTYTSPATARSRPTTSRRTPASRRSTNRYAMIFDSHGVPIWWYRAPVVGPRVLPSGNILWFLSDGQSSHYEIRRLDGSLVRTLKHGQRQCRQHPRPAAAGWRQLPDRGAHEQTPHRHKRLWGLERRRRSKRRASGGERDGQLLWDWRSEDHISLAETGRWWPYVIKHGSTNGYYDLVHWNSIEPHGNSVIASFRHLDAVYRIRKSNGSIAWKLGGTPTPQSLEVRDDPESYTFGGQHDARLLSDGTLSVFDNRTGLDDAKPRAVRYEIDQAAGTATLLQSISDPEVPLLVLLRVGSAPAESGLVDRLGPGDPPGNGLDRRLQTRWPADLPPHVRFHVQLPGTASPRRRVFRARSTSRHERHVLGGVWLIVRP